MRHAIAGNRFGRHSSWRKATLRDLAKAILLEQRICTTQAKAKQARKLVDKLITLGKKGTLAAKRRAFAILSDHQAVSDLFAKTSPRFKNRIGGYTRIIKLGNRRGDNAALAYLELTEKEAVIVSKPKLAAVPRHGHEHHGHEHHEHGAVTETTPEEAKPKPKTTVKEQPPKKDVVKEDVQKPPAGPQKPARGKFMSGIRTMFNRGSSSSGK